MAEKVILQHRTLEPKNKLNENNEKLMARHVVGAEPGCSLRS